MKRPVENAARPRPSLIARQKLATIRRVARYVRNGKSKAKAAQLVGTSVPTLWRDTKKFRAQGLAGLEPRFANCGRKSELARLRVPKWILCRVEHLALRQGCGVVAAWKKFSRTTDCPVALARRIRKSIPPSFYEATRLSTVRVRLGKHVTRAASLRAATKTEKQK
jgi:transposase